MSKRAPRVNDVSAWLLHAAPWRETSQLLQVFTRDHGVVALVAKGSKRPYSALRAVLHAFQPLNISWAGSGEVRNLVRAELAGMLALGGKSFMSAWYLNELVLRLLPREDPHPLLFDAYSTALRQLVQAPAQAAALRRFEWVLLQEAGYGVDEPMPDFDNRDTGRQLRTQLRDRLDAVLERPLRTRKVLMELQQF